MQSESMFVKIIKNLGKRKPRSLQYIIWLVEALYHSKLQGNRNKIKLSDKNISQLFISITLTVLTNSAMRGEIKQFPSHQSTGELPGCRCFHIVSCTSTVSKNLSAQKCEEYMSKHDTCALIQPHIHFCYHVSFIIHFT